MANIQFKTQEELAQEKLQNFRESAKCSAFQARAVLRTAGLYDQVKAIMEDPATDPIVVDAWEYETEFRRNSPTILSLGAELGLTDEQIDDLFEQAKTIEA